MSDTSSKPRVLLVDDEQDYNDTITFWLKAKGYPVTQAASGIEALEILQGQSHDVVFLDINMPRMDGIETLRRIRERHAALPVIMVTAAFQAEVKFKEARALGISGFFPKGSSLNQLGHVLEVALKMLRTTDRAGTLPAGEEIQPADGTAAAGDERGP